VSLELEGVKTEAEIKADQTREQVSYRNLGSLATGYSILKSTKGPAQQGSGPREGPIRLHGDPLFSRCSLGIGICYSGCGESSICRTLYRLMLAWEGQA
jgi:hypothetical protein